MNKQNIWFITLLSIIIILTIYYITIPNNLLEEYTNDIENTNEQVVLNEEDSLATLKLEQEEETLNTISTLEQNLLDNTKSITEKNEYYESLKNINSTKAKEEELEKLLKESLGYESLIKINNNEVNIVISSTTHDKEIANNIINLIEKEFKTPKYITVKFQ